MDVKKLEEIKARALKEMGPRAVEPDYGGTRTVLVCGGTGCTSGHSRNILEHFKKRVAEEKLDVKVIMTGCFGLCALGPIVIVYPEGAFYSQVTEDHVDEIVEEHLLKGRIVKRLLYDETVTMDDVKSLQETDF